MPSDIFLPSKEKQYKQLTEKAEVWVDILTRNIEFFRQQQQVKKPSSFTQDCIPVITEMLHTTEKFLRNQSNPASTYGTIPSGAATIRNTLFFYGVEKEKMFVFHRLQEFLNKIDALAQELKSFLPSTPHIARTAHT